MTEAEWLTGTVPYELLKHRMTLDERKRRLLDCACVRRVLHLLVDTQYLDAVSAAEDFADGKLIWNEMKGTARRKANASLRELRPRLRTHYSRYAAEAAVATTNRQAKNEGMLLAASAMGYATNDYKTNLEREMAEQVKLVHDIFGNPFRPTTIDPSWLTSTVLALATGIYEDKAFDRMPILADALQDAGCDNDEILNHCRQPGEHCRGCWCVDLVLGRT
jgi:hypothetical protein